MMERKSATARQARCHRCGCIVILSDEFDDSQGCDIASPDVVLRVYNSNPDSAERAKAQTEANAFCPSACP